jgi:outer membrane lipoprotein carrier protein
MVSNRTSGALVRLLGIATIFLGALQVWGVSEDVQSLARALDDHYNRLKSLKADFTEVYRGNGMERTETGMLYLKKPGKMRWEYRSPKEKLFVSDGREAWFYVPSDRQARRTEVKKLEDLRSPLAFLLGKTKLEKELQNLSFAPDVPVSAQGNTVLRGVPKGLQDRINQVLVESTSDHQICRIVLEEADGAMTEYRFQKMEENAAVGEDRFDFTPPPGVETVTGDVGQ